MLVDRKFSLTGELKDDTKETSYEALGLASYSNSKPPFLSYQSIFDTLWKQVILYIELLTRIICINQIHSKMQKQFLTNR